MLWNAVNRLWDELQRLTPPLGASFIVGIALTRAYYGQMLSTLRLDAFFSGLPLVGGLDGIVALFMGSAFLYLPAATLAPRIAPLLSRAPFMAACALAGAAAIGAVGVVVEDGSAAPLVMFALALATGFCHSAVFLAWLELLGRKRTRDALATYAASFFLFFLIWAILTLCPQAVQFGACSLFLPLAALLLVPANRTLPPMTVAATSPALSSNGLSQDDATNTRAATNGPAESAAMQAAAVRTPSLKAFWKLALWVAAFALSYGAGDGITSLAYSTWSTRIGMAVTEGLILTGTIFFAKRFDFTILQKFTLLFMVVGLLATFANFHDVAVGQVLLSIGNESYLCMAYATAWSVSYRLRIPALRPCAVVLGVNVTMLSIGLTLVQSMGNITALEPLRALVPGIFILGAIAASFLSFGKNTYAIGTNGGGEPKRDDATSSPQPADGTSTVSNLASRGGLSNRESVILGYLARGLSAPEIADELFLAPSTIRAHTSRIYQKLNIHSRRELNALLGLHDNPPLS